MDSSIAYFEVDVDYSIRSRDHSESVKRQTKAAIDKQRDEGTLVLKPGTQMDPQSERNVQIKSEHSQTEN